MLQVRADHLRRYFSDRAAAELLPDEVIDIYQNLLVVLQRLGMFERRVIRHAVKRLRARFTGFGMVFVLRLLAADIVIIRVIYQLVDIFRGAHPSSWHLSFLPAALYDSRKRCDVRAEATPLVVDPLEDDPAIWKVGMRSWRISLACGASYLRFLVSGIFWFMASSGIVYFHHSFSLLPFFLGRKMGFPADTGNHLILPRFTLHRGLISPIQIGRSAENRFNEREPRALSRVRYDLPLFYSFCRKI